MATWGVHSFDNDDAVEWAQAYREMGLSVAGSTIQVALEDHANNRLTSSIAARAVAAAEAVAHALGRGNPEAARLFGPAPAADAAAAKALILQASDALAAVAAASELAQIWKDVGAAEHAEWTASLAELGARLGGGTAAARPAARPAAGADPAAPVSGDPDVEAVMAAIDGLSRQIAALREEMTENFARLARRTEGDRR